MRWVPVVVEAQNSPETLKINRSIESAKKKFAGKFSGTVVCRKLLVLAGGMKNPARCLVKEERGIYEWYVCVYV